MSQSPEGVHLADLQSGWLDVDDQNPFMESIEYNTQDFPLDDGSRSPPHEEPDLLEDPATYRPNSVGDWGIGQYVGESFEGLELNRDCGLSNYEMSDSTFGMTNNTGMDTDPSQFIPETINSMLNPESTNNRTYRTPNILDPPQSLNDTEYASPWPQSGYWSEDISANLRPPAYTPYKSSAASHSQYSDSAWETVPPTPFADDFDLRPMPDDKSASTQSYNDPKTGIWSQESTYGRGTTDLPKTGMYLNNETDPTTTRLLTERLQQVLADADAATPFGTDSQSNKGTLLESAAFGAYSGAGMAASSFLPPSTAGGQITSNGESGVSIMINGTMSVAAFPVHQPPGVDYPVVPPGSDTRFLRNIAPRMVLDNPHLIPANLPPAVLVDTSASASPPSASAGTSTTGISRCTHRGCRAKFTGTAKKDNLRRHKRHHHSDKPKPTCPECHIAFQSGRPDNLIRHMRSQHPGQPLPSSLTVRTKKIGSNTVTFQHHVVSKRPRQRT